MEKKDSVVEFETPLKRGETEIKSVELIKPTAGSLRGVRLADLCQSDVDALLTASLANLSNYGTNCTVAR